MMDLDIRNTLKLTELKHFYLDGCSRIVDELSLRNGEARIDIAVVNSSLHGFEIKSEKDTLVRLPHQINIYSKVFDYLTVCINQKHLGGVSKIIPDWCGILVAFTQDGAVKLEMLRLPYKNDGVDKLSIAQLLWKEEALEALKMLGFNKGLSSKSRKQLWVMLAELSTTDDVSRFVREKLLIRANWRSDQQFHNLL